MLPFYTKLFAYVWYVCFATCCVTQSSILKQNMYQSSILKQNMIVTQMIPKFCKCITNDTSVFYFYHKWYLLTQNYLVTFSIRVLQHVV
jgi:hypothetical protein